MNKISIKVTLLYISLAIVNIAFFTIIIFENQVDLIADNTKYEAEILADKIYSSMDTVSREINSDTDTGRQRLSGLIKHLDLLLTDYTLFGDDGVIHHTTDSTATLDDRAINAAMRAITNRDFQNRRYFTEVTEKPYAVHFYMPLIIAGYEESVLYFSLQMKDVSSRLGELYRMVFVIIAIIAVFHILFAFLLFGIIIKPIKDLHKRSIQISKGKLDARVQVRRRDEIGELGSAFNSMADSIQDTIGQLALKNEIMENELVMAGEIQTAIYPKQRKTALFELAVHHAPLEKVSGDYYDIFDMGKGRIGVLIADVAGHGVPAALVTMCIKELFSELTRKYSNPMQLFKAINSQVLHLLDESSGFFTAFFVVIHPDGSVEFTNAGHHPGYIMRNGKDTLDIMDSKGFFLGVSEEMSSSFECKKERVSSGDKIILFTDGIIEAQNEKQQQYEQERLLALVKQKYLSKGDVIIDHVMQDVTRFCGSVPRRDDETLIVIDIL
jgi:sigma-B regulation protein RsbU (phosphoserine phosphatase)